MLISIGDLGPLALGICGGYVFLLGVRWAWRYLRG